MHFTRKDSATPAERSLLVLAAIANRHRIRILTMLMRDGHKFVGELSRSLNMKRSLLEFHLVKLLEAGLIAKSLYSIDSGKTRLYFSAVEYGTTFQPVVLAEIALGCAIDEHDDLGFLLPYVCAAEKLEHILRLHAPQK